MVRREGVSAVRYLPRLRVEFPGFSADPPSEFSAVFTMHLFFFQFAEFTHAIVGRPGTLCLIYEGLFIFCR